MKRLKLIQDDLDIDFVHVYASHGKLTHLICTIHIDMVNEIFSDEIENHFGKKGAKPLTINYYGPDWTIEG